MVGGGPGPRAAAPGESMNEVEIARRFGVSRTPLRVAFNRLNTEGFLRFIPGKGFFCRELDAHEVFDLYEFRKSIEVAAIRLSVQRARDEDIRALLAFLDETGPDPGKRSTIELVALDEMFHERLWPCPATRKCCGYCATSMPASVSSAGSTWIAAIAG
jgi:DNA-binding GntR family transcriptional regulator